MEYVSGYSKSSSHSQSPSLSLHGSSSSSVPVVKGNFSLNGSSFLTNSRFETGKKDQDCGKSGSSHNGYQNPGCSVRSRYVHKKPSFH